MAKTTVSELQVLISANATAFQAQLDAVKKQMASMGAISNKTSGKLGAGLKSTALRYIGLGAAITGAFKAMKAASSYIEDENLFAVSMRNAADETRAWSDQVERSVGVSGAWLRKYTGIMTNMSASMGLSHKEASKLGKNVALLSQDLASFYNISPEAAFEKMQSAMAGMPRPLQDLGIMVRDQELQQTALALGIRKTNGEFTAAQKALLTYETVIRATKNAQGDLARTLNTPANQMRMLATNARNLGVAIGTMFQPLLSVALPALNAIVMAATSAIRALAGLFGIEFKADAGGVGEVASGVGGIGEAADKAGGKVKKLKGQLASFDEMNTIQEQDSGSGSGGGGGAGSLPQIDWSKYNAGLDNVKNKAVAMAEAIKKAFKDFGKGFDFAKIGNAFKRFFNDANKLFKPIGKILGDLWGYFKPFIYWRANDLLPAFLNAIGGALQFIGSVVGAIWDTALKPLIDLFLVPIAQFTGGVIVWVLNAIGDGLRWIANNEAAVGIITGLVDAFTAYHGVLLLVNAASAVYQTAMGVITGVQLALNGAIIAGTTATGAFAVGLGAVSSVVGFVTSVVTIFKGIISSLLTPLGLISVAIGGIVTVVGFMTGAFSGATSEKEKHRQKTEELRNKMTEEEKQIDRNKDGIIEYTERVQALTNAKLDAANSTLTRIRTGRELKEAEKKYFPIIDDLKTKTTLTKEEQEKLEEAEASLERAQMRLKQATDNEAEAKKKSSEETKKLIEEEKKRTIQSRNAEITTLNNAKAFKKIEEVLNPSIVKLEEYRDGFGKLRSHTVEDTNAIRNAVIENFNKISNTHKAELDKASGRYKVVSKEVASFGSLYDGFGFSAGANYQRGIERGLNNNQWRVNNAARNVFRGMLNAYNNESGTHSPSRVMIRQAGFLSEGVAIGLEKTMGQAADKAREMARRIADSFEESGMKNITSNRLNFPNIKPISTSISHRLVDSLKIDSSVIENRPIHLKVDLDGSNIVDTVVKGVNDLSFLKNTSVIDF